MSLDYVAYKTCGCLEFWASGERGDKMRLTGAVRISKSEVNRMHFSCPKCNPLTCAGCGVSSADEPTVMQRCCRVACEDCHTKCLVNGRPMMRCN